MERRGRVVGSMYVKEDKKEEDGEEEEERWKMEDVGKDGGGVE